MNEQEQFTFGDKVNLFGSHEGIVVKIDKENQIAEVKSKAFGWNGIVTYIVPLEMLVKTKPITEVKKEDPVEN